MKDITSTYAGYYQHTEIDGEGTLLESTIRARLCERLKNARVNDWPMEDVWRVLNAWPKAVTK